MISIIAALLTSPDSYALYLLLKTTEQKICYCVCQFWLIIITIINVLNINWQTVTVVLLVYIGILVYCVKTAISMED